MRTLIVFNMMALFLDVAALDLTGILGCNRKSAETHIALDNSAAVSSDTFSQSKMFVRKLVNKLLDEMLHDHVIIIHTFGDKVYENKTMTKGMLKNNRKKAIDDLVFQGTKSPSVETSLQYVMDKIVTSAQRVKIYIYVGPGKNIGTTTTYKAAFEASRYYDLQLFAVHTAPITNSVRKELEKYFALELDYCSPDAVVSRPRKLISKNVEMAYERIQELVLDSCEDCYLPTIDMAVVVDSTIPGHRRSNLVTILQRFLLSFHIGDKTKQVQVRLIGYGDQQTEQQNFGFDQHKTIHDVLKTVDYSMPSSCARTSKMTHALTIAAKHLKEDKNSTRSGLVQVIVVFTDIVSSSDIAEAARIRQDGIQTIIVGYPRMDEIKMKQFSNNPWLAIDGNDAAVTSYDNEVQGLGAEIAKRTCFLAKFGPNIV